MKPPLLFFGLRCTVLLGLFTLSHAQGAVLFESFTSLGDFSPANTTLGAEFTVGSLDIVVSDVGVYDAGGDGLVESHDMGIWNNVGTLLATATVPSGTAAPLSGDIRYVTLASPLTLSAGATYTIGAYFPTELFGGNNYPPHHFTFNSALAAVDADRNYQSLSGSLQFPNHSGGDFDYYAVNMQFAAVPEPREYALAAGTGLLGFAIWRRRCGKKRKTSGA